MTWQAVASKDFQDASRSRWLWVLTGLFVLIFAAPAVLIFGGGLGSAPKDAGNTDGYLYLMKQGTSIIVPLISVVVGYAAVTRERESGTMKLLLSLPHSRDDMVFGKVIGRAGVVGVAILVGVVVTAVALVVTGLEFRIVNYLVFVLLTLLLGLVFVGLATGISAAVSTSRRAMGLTMSIYMFFVVLWNAFANQVANLLSETIGVGTATQFQTIMFLKLLNPTAAYKTLLNSALLSAQPDIQNHVFQARVRMFGGGTGMEILARRQTAAKAINETVPLWASDLFVVIYMLVWLFVPVAIGYFLFQKADL
mgnify:CR=1 FL=1